jgi:hypothetical protein
MRLKLISCEVFYREMCFAISQSPHQVDLEFLPKGLHDIETRLMLGRIQERIDSVDESMYHAIIFGYGLCNNGIEGLTARGIPLVVPRAHDCITVFLGSKERYLSYFNTNPGVYFKTSGWIERGTPGKEFDQLSIQQKTGLDLSYAELVKKYGEENARYLFEELSKYKDRYHEFTYIEMGIEPDDRFERQTREDAEKAGWGFQKVSGDMSLITKLVNGDWNDAEFLVVNPGYRILANFKDNVIEAVPVDTGDREPK